MQRSQNHADRISSPSDLISFRNWDKSPQLITLSESFTDATSVLTVTDATSVLTAPSADTTGAAATGAASFNNQSSIKVHVGGATYDLNNCTFRQLERLPWRLNSKGCHVLQTSPEIFEILLNHVLFHSFPDLKEISPIDIEELEPMVLLLGFKELEKHLKQKNAMFRSNSLKRRHQKKNRAGSESDHLLAGDHESKPSIKKDAGAWSKVRQIIRRNKQLSHSEICAASEALN